MGNRAVVVFADLESGEMSPAAYIHWGGEKVRELLEAALPRMRQGDFDYSCARFIGVCHEKSPSTNTGLGCFNICPETLEHVRSNNFSHGDAGVFVVDVNTWKVEAFNGDGFGEVDVYDDESDEYVMELQLDSSKVPK